MSRKCKKSKKKLYRLGTQGEEEEILVHSTEYEGRRRGHQPSSRRDWADQL